MKRFFTAIGQDCHSIETPKRKPLILGEVEFKDANFSLEVDSDDDNGDVVVHALVKAISSATMFYTRKYQNHTKISEALKEAREKDIVIDNISISIQAIRPKISKREIERMSDSIARLIERPPYTGVGITITTGEGLTEFGKGNGIFVTVLVNCSKGSEYD